MAYFVLSRHTLSPHLIPHLVATLSRIHLVELLSCCYRDSYDEVSRLSVTEQVCRLSACICLHPDAYRGPMNVGEADQVWAAPTLVDGCRQSDRQASTFERYQKMEARTGLEPV